MIILWSIWNKVIFFIHSFEWGKKKKAQSYNVKQPMKQRVLKVEMYLNLKHLAAQLAQTTGKAKWAGGSEVGADCTAKKQPIWFQVFFWLLTKYEDRLFILSTRKRNQMGKHHSYSITISYKNGKNFRDNYTSSSSNLSKIIV